MSRPGKLNSVCKDEKQLVSKKNTKVSQLHWKLMTQSLKVYHVSTNPPARDEKERLCILKKKSNGKSIKDKSPRTIVKDEKTSNEEINFVNNGKRKMINDCDHKCPKAVGFSDPGVVLHCSECESEKRRESTNVLIRWTRLNP